MALTSGSPAARVQAADHVADVGIDHLFVADHVSFHGGGGSDGLVHAASLTAISELPVHVGVHLLALRHPLVVARQIVDVVARAPGQLVFGVGVGGEDPVEWWNCGVDPRTRGRRTNEALDLLIRLIAGERLDHEGEFFRMEGAAVRPVPAEPVPVVVGGRSDAALARAGRRGLPWLGAWVTPARFARSVATVTEHAESHHHHPPPSGHGLQAWIGVGPDRATARDRVARGMHEFYRLPFEPFERTTPYGTVDDVVDALRPYLAVGCRSFNLHPCAGGEAEGIDAVAEIAEALRRP